MSEPTVLFLIMLPVIAIIGGGFCIAQFSMDKNRILVAAQRQGWKNINIKWSPFAPGWLFERGERHYLVTFKDREGNPGARYCKTSMLTGVYWKG